MAWEVDDGGARVASALAFLELREEVQVEEEATWTRPWCSGID